MQDIQKVAIVGCGSIGASWAALFLVQGLEVTVFDINPSTEAFLRNLVADALPVLSSLGLVKKTEAQVSDIRFTTDMAKALVDADFVQENGPEKLEFKRKLFNDITAIVESNTIIATSSSGLTCSSIQEGMHTSSHPERCVVGHPFNPPHLIPLVEVVAGDQTSAETVDSTMRFYERMGKKAVNVKKEVIGHVANRLQAALMREVMHLLQEDVANVEDIDKAMSYGPGLRWGVMGPSLLFHLGGGEGGIKYMADHLLAPLMSWYAPKDPEITDELKQKWVSGTMQAVGPREYRQLARQRDEELVRLLNVRKEWDDYAKSSRDPQAKAMGSHCQQRLYILDTDLSHSNQETRQGRIVSCLTDGTELHTVIDNIPTLPDGITIDHASKHMYWTNMGTSFKTNSGSIERANLDGSNRRTIVPAGSCGVFTPKQITIAKQSRKLYWCDREGMKVMRANLDGSGPEVLISTGTTEEDRLDQLKWCVGIAVDEKRGLFYWTQKGPSKGNKGRIFRAPIQSPHEGRERSIELVFENLPEPIDLELDEETGTLYWTDRGDPPAGNSLNRANIAVDSQKETLAVRFHETIGLSIDRDAGLAYVTDLAGGIYTVDVKTREKRVLFTELGDITGIAWA
ncbi:hypothetical protein LZ31DRAFT_583640 [Colletotrichum somersetense]|nr:hypothetical protein LZ31DRAFT_583640 [Colletotrichum somersetense]